MLFISIQNAFEKLLSYTLDNVNYTNRGVGLYTGISGEILLLSEVYLLSKEAIILDKIYALIDLGMEHIDLNSEINPNMDPTFSSGICGFAWVVNYLIKNNILDKDTNDSLDELDSVIFQHMNDQLNYNNFDLINGAMGMAIHFINRGKFNYASVMLDYLDENKVVYENELLWTTNKFNPDGHLTYDFSLAHGMAGILYFLSRCYKNNIDRALCKRLISGCLSFYEKNLQEISNGGSYYPNTIKVDHYRTTYHRPVKSRLAWCYGDLGILYTIYNTALVIDDQVLVNTTLERLVNTSKRIHPGETNVSDPWFCHGSAGNAFVYYKLYGLTKLKEFSEARDFWLDKTLEFNLFEQEDMSPAIPAPYKFTDNILEGRTGVGLVYFACLNSRSAHWDNCLMLGY
jgi:lantibiotic modifying enzyme